jgi:hypothetical protein
MKTLCHVIYLVCYIPHVELDTVHSIEQKYLYTDLQNNVIIATGLPIVALLHALLTGFPENNENLN